VYKSALSSLRIDRVIKLGILRRAVLGRRTTGEVRNAYKNESENLWGGGGQLSGSVIV
jgi:hypothetical protein